MLPLCTVCLSKYVQSNGFSSHLNQKHQLVLMAKQFSYIVAFKLSVIEFAKKTENPQANREFGVNKKLVVKRATYTPVVRNLIFDFDGLFWGCDLYFGVTYTPANMVYDIKNGDYCE